MNLKDFIVSTITEISEGVTEADEKLKDAGGLVNPSTYSNDNQIAARTTLNFDIALSAKQDKEGGADAKVGLWVVDASLGGKVSHANESISRLSFSIDVVLPYDQFQFARTPFVEDPKD